MNYAIIDDNGIIDEADEETVRESWHGIVSREDVPPHEGDLRLVRIEEVWNG